MARAVARTEDRDLGPISRVWTNVVGIDADAIGVELHQVHCIRSHTPAGKNGSLVGKGPIMLVQQSLHKLAVTSIPFLLVRSFARLRSFGFRVRSEPEATSCLISPYNPFLASPHCASKGFLRARRRSNQNITALPAIIVDAPPINTPTRETRDGYKTSSVQKRNLLRTITIAPRQQQRIRGGGGIECGIFSSILR